MKRKDSNKKIDKIIESVEKNGFNIEELVTELKALRELALIEEDPLVVKILRLAYEHLEENETFAVFTQKPEVDEEGEEIEDEENENESMTAEEHFSYFMNLLIKADNKYNREELQYIKAQLLGR